MPSTFYKVEALPKVLVLGVPENGPERKMSQIVKTENVPEF